MRALVLAALLVACGAPSPSAQTPAKVKAAPASTCAISEPTKELMRTLHHPLVIEAYVSQQTPSAKAFAIKLESFLAAFAGVSANVVPRIIDPVTSEEKKRAEKAGLKAVDDGGASIYSGIVVTYGKESDVIPVLLPANDNVGLEYWLANKIRQTVDKAEGIHHRIGVLVGHDEMSLGETNLVPVQTGKPSMRDVVVRNFPYVEFVDVDLHGGAPVDGTLEGLIVTQPARDLEDHELHALDDFVMRGKTLVVIASAVNVSPGDAAMIATLSTHNLAPLLEGYGIEMHRDVVLDFGHAFKVELLTQSGLASMRFPQILEVTEDALDTGYPAFFRMEQVVLPFASSLTIHPDKQPGASLKTIARSSQQSIHDTHESVGLGLQAWKPKGEWKSYDVAAYAEGRLQSVFGSKTSAATARVLVIASAQMTANPFARAGNAARSNDEGDKLLQIAGPYADLQRGAVPLLYSIMTFVNVLDMIANGPGLSAISAHSPCAR
jgi:ABC-type uncharacterized transport system involved in gliding motility auxiliary subunit